MNHSAFDNLFGLSFNWSPVDRLIVFFGAYYIYVALLIVVVVVSFLSWERQKKVAVSLSAFGAALVARYVVAGLIRFLYEHPRPYTALGIPHLLTNTSSSFPSGHTIFLFALGTVLFFHNKPLAYFTYASGLVIGTARIMAGVHYPADIFGGIVLGTTVGFAAAKLLKRIG